jgi:Ca2+-binding RTX toxin-like protein
MDIIGTSGDDTLTGTPENDTIDGGAGADRVDYSAATGPVTIDGSLGTVTGGSSVGIDLLMDVEEVVGTAFGDRYTGSFEILPPSRVFVGGAGNDTVFGFNRTVVSYQDASGPIRVQADPTGDLYRVTGDPSVGIDSIHGVLWIIGSDFDDTMVGTRESRGADDEHTPAEDHFVGGAGDDFLDGAGDFDTVSYAFDDLPDGIEVDLGAGLVNSATGQDTLRSIETVQGSMGDDRFDASTFSLTSLNRGSFTVRNDFEGLAGNDSVTGSAFTRVIYTSALEPVLVNLALGIAMGGPSVGTDSFESVVRVRGSEYGDTLIGAGRGEEFEGADGNDELAGGNGNDTLHGEAGDDHLAGDAGRDDLRGGAGNDELSGGPGNDTLWGGTGTDTLAGGLGDDAYSFGSTQTLIENPGEGRDSITVLGSLVLPEHFEDLRLNGPGAGTGNAAANLIIGSAGNDTLDGRGGADTLRGGEGSDYYTIGPGDMVIEVADEPGGPASTDSALVLAGVFSVPEHLENASMGARAGNAWMTGSSSPNHIAGNDGANILSGGAGADTLEGGRGDDTLMGGAGGDTLDGGRGADVMEGGVGGDLYVVGSVRDQIIELAAGGVDTVWVEAPRYALAANLENALVLYDDGAFIAGNALGNLLVGGAGNDTLEGGGGADRFRLNEGAGVDRIVDFVSGVDRIVVDGTVFTTPDLFAYDEASGMLSYGGVPLAVLNAGAGLTAGDFQFL